MKTFLCTALLAGLLPPSFAMQSNTSVFNSLKTADGTYLTLQVRRQAAGDLARTLRGIPLNERSVSALNAQIYNVGLRVNSRSEVFLLSQSEYDALAAVSLAARKAHVRDMMKESLARYSTFLEGSHDVP